MKETKTLGELFSFPGFKAKQQLLGIFGESKARVVELKRQKKDPYVQVAERAIDAITMQRFEKYEISMLWGGEYIFALNSDESSVLAVEE